MDQGLEKQDITLCQRAPNESTNVKFSYDGLSYECPLHEIGSARALFEVGAKCDLIIEDFTLDEFEQVNEKELRFRGLGIESCTEIIEMILYSVKHEDLGCFGNLLYHIASQKKDSICIVHTEQEGSGERVTNPYIAYMVNSHTTCTFLADEGFSIKDNYDNTVTITARCNKLMCETVSGDYWVYSIDKDTKISKDMILSWLLNQRLVPVVKVVQDVQDLEDAKGSNVSSRLHLDFPESRLTLGSIWLLDAIIQSGNIYAVNIG